MLISFEKTWEIEIHPKSKPVLVSYRKFFEVCLAIFQHYEWKAWIVLKKSFGNFFNIVALNAQVN